MKHTFIILPILAILLASCNMENEVTEPSFSEAGMLKKRIAQDLPEGTPARNVEDYLVKNGIKEQSFSVDRRTLQAEKTIKIKRYFPPIDSNSMRVECKFDSNERLQSCSVFISSKKCCGQ